MIEPRTYTLAVRRLQLNIVEWGDPEAPPLILQHGGRDHARNWDWVANAFAATHRVIAPDMRGHGDSEWSSDGDYEMLDYLDDFAGIVAALDLPPCPMIGHSLGANIVTRFVGLYPDRATRLVNIEGLGDSPEAAARRAAADPIEALRKWITRRADVTARTPRDFPDRAALASRLREADHRLDEATLDHLATHAARANADGSVRPKHDPALGPTSPIDISQATKERLWAAIACPVLLVYGAESWASNPAVDGRAGHFRDVRVELLEGAGHWVHHDRRDAFIALVRAFLA
ncbi:alpha/beta fold hydrolase [Sphingomonas histidinilytica]|jgi:pimeloyl-ACP methyl ester carboxylesterase|uniref:Pimeloyl-ACP methyl ester carboxylesterase n=1 Tax=Rhizorhabdus histidinilytica TaxID=439228 RepID=A0A1T5FGV2_9SPHN|nr:alpha/beta hydrolase [Rhizorhabdus histidinilytica]MBO9375647.1 alpha/beta fold hydrolase [Rhizorhabdus histidinilytica]QEH81089.1 alpha/beta hydrolase [Sphingomonas sp. C8-2]SKB95337.1 Pimeloyl-ACP methyl ester carboxylesterase [Rhizorhabdus histidinilytica]